MRDDTTTRICNVCKTEYPITAEFFYKDKKAKHGLSYHCKDCQKQKASRWQSYNKDKRKKICERYRENNLDKCRQSAREHYHRYRDEINQHYHDNKDEINTHRRDRYTNDEEYRNKAIENSRNYYYQHHEENKEKRRKYYQDTRDSRISYVLIWRSENPEKVKRYNNIWVNRNRDAVRSYCRNRRARLKNGGTHTAADIRSLYEGQGGKCWYCACDVGDDYHVDHFIPLSMGGSNDVGNLRIACPTCNLQKNAKHPHHWDGRLL